jgi:hypothetical protein
MRIKHLATALAVAGVVALGAAGIGHALIPATPVPSSHPVAVHTPRSTPADVVPAPVKPAAPTPATHHAGVPTATAPGSIPGLASAGDDTCVLRDANQQPTAVVPDTDPRCVMTPMDTSNTPCLQVCQTDEGPWQCTVKAGKAYCGRVGA